MSGGRWGGEASVFNQTADAQWIARMSPAVAPHLEAVFRTGAQEAESMADEGREVNPNWAVLGLARAVLGVPEEDRT